MSTSERLTSACSRLSSVRWGRARTFGTIGGETQQRYNATGSSEIVSVKCASLTTWKASCQRYDSGLVRCSGLWKLSVYSVLILANASVSTSGIWYLCAIRTRTSGNRNCTRSRPRRHLTHVRYLNALMMERSITYVLPLYRIDRNCLMSEAVSETRTMGQPSSASSPLIGGIENMSGENTPRWTLKAVRSATITTLPSSNQTSVSCLSWTLAAPAAACPDSESISASA